MSVGGGDGGGAEVSRLEAAQKLVRAHTHKLSSSNPWPPRRPIGVSQRWSFWALEMML